MIETVLNKFEEVADEYQFKESDGIFKLSLKYAVEGARPFKFYWDLKKCTSEQVI